MPTFSDIETSYVQRYAQDVQHCLQQKTTRLRNQVSQKLDCSGIAEFIDRIGNASAENKNARFADSLFNQLLINVGELQHDHIMQDFL